METVHVLDAFVCGKGGGPDELRLEAIGPTERELLDSAVVIFPVDTAGDPGADEVKFSEAVCVKLAALLELLKAGAEGEGTGAPGKVPLDRGTVEGPDAAGVPGPVDKPGWLVELPEGNGGLGPDNGNEIEDVEPPVGQKGVKLEIEEPVIVGPYVLVLLGRGNGVWCEVALSLDEPETEVWEGDPSVCDASEGI